MNKIIIISVIVLLIIVVSYFIMTSCKEQFVSQKYSSQNLIDMFNSLELAEKRCSNLEERQSISNEKEQLKLNEATFNELEELDKKINELREIVKNLSIEKNKRDNINKKCRADKQIKLNQNYDLVSQLNKDNLVDDNSINFDLNISDSLKQLKFANNQNIKPKNDVKCKKKNSKDYINLNTADIKNKCYGCDSNKLKDNYSIINKNF